MSQSSDLLKLVSWTWQEVKARTANLHHDCVAGNCVILRCQYGPKSLECSQDLVKSVPWRIKAVLNRRELETTNLKLKLETEMEEGNEAHKNTQPCGTMWQQAEEDRGLNTQRIMRGWETRLEVIWHNDGGSKNEYTKHRTRDYQNKNKRHTLRYGRNTGTGDQTDMGTQSTGKTERKEGREEQYQNKRLELQM